MPEDLQGRYFDWICALVGGGDKRELLAYLHSRPFEYDQGVYILDQNRADDGIDLRYRFGGEEGLPDPVVSAYLDRGPCSMLEMMAALALRCEEDIMADPEQGDRTPDWFDVMLYSMGISDLTDGNFDHDAAEAAVDRVLNHDYAPNGRGGLFYIPGHTARDMRYCEIWYQMMWYLDYLEDIKNG